MSKPKVQSLEYHNKLLHRQFFGDRNEDKGNSKVPPGNLRE